MPAQKLASPASPRPNYLERDNNRTLSLLTGSLAACAPLDNAFLAIEKRRTARRKVHDLAFHLLK
jgi:hypothetical protein